jgi:hypothetical protein
MALALVVWLGMRETSSRDVRLEAFVGDVDADMLAASFGSGDAELVAGTSDVDRARASRGTSEPDQDDARATPSAVNTSGLTVVVTSRATGAPLPGTQLWALGDEFCLGRANRRGEVNFPDLSGTIEFGVKGTSALMDGTFVVIGGEDEPRESLELSVPSGTHRTVTIALTEGASIVGRIFDADGLALRQFRFLRLGADGDQWVEPLPVVTDDAGSFEVIGLAPGWYLLGPDPAKDEVFAYARIELARGERRVVALQLLPAQQVRVTVSLRGVGRGESWGLPVRFLLERADHLGGLVPTSSGQARAPLWNDGLAPLEITRPLRAGPHVLRVASSNGAWTTPFEGGPGAVRRYTTCIAPAREVALRFEVAEGSREVELEALVPDLGEIAELELTVVRADEHALAGRRSFPSVSMEWRDRSGEARASGVIAGAGTNTMTVFVDLDEVQSRALEIRSRVGSLEPQILAALTLRPGPQRATVDVPHQ